MNPRQSFTALAMLSCIGLVLTVPQRTLVGYDGGGSGLRAHFRTFVVTAYCPCAKCCGRWARNHTRSRRLACGEPLVEAGTHFVAAPPGMEFGTMLRIPGYASGRPVPALDRGGEIVGNRLDVFFPSHAEALQWGSRKLTVTVTPSDN